MNIESGDKIVLNGVIHTIDSVLMPSDVSISEYLGTHETNFADLYAALVLEGFENALECKHKIYALKYRERERGGGALLHCASLTKMTKYFVFGTII